MAKRRDGYPETSVPGDRQDTFGVRDVIASYDVGAPTLVPEYESLSFEDIHAQVLDLLPDCAGCILDVGAGTADEIPRGLRRTGTTWSQWNRPRSCVRPGRSATDRPTSGG